MLVPLLRWLPALAWMGGIFYWSSQSSLPISDRPDADQLHLFAHVIAYSTLALLLAAAIGTSPRGLAIAFVLATLYGIGDEIHQSFVPGRHGRVQEMVLNSVSAAAALAVFASLRWLVLSVVSGRWSVVSGRSTELTTDH